MGGTRGIKKKPKVGIIVVVFDPDTKVAIQEGEEELAAPAFPYLNEREFRDACLKAFLKAGGENLHQ